MGSVPFQGHNRAGSSPPRSAPKYQREEGAQASGCSSGPHGPTSGCLDARRYVPAGSSRQQPANSSDGRLRLKKSRLPANPSALFCRLAVPRGHREPTRGSFDSEKSREDLTTHKLAPLKGFILWRSTSSGLPLSTEDRIRGRVWWQLHRWQETAPDGGT